MKPDKIIFLCFFVIVTAGLLFTACKKETGYTIVTTPDNSASQAVIAADELNVNYEFDQAIIDAIVATSISPTTGGRTSGNINTIISGAVIDTSKISSGTIKIMYYGKNANNTKGLLGEVDIILAVDSGKVIPWGIKGSVASIIFSQYEVTVLNSNPVQSLWLNGAGSITNISGGLLNNIADSLLVPGDSLIDKASAQLEYTYNDNPILQTWVWNFNQLRVFNFNDTTITMSIRGDTIVNGINNISTSGTTRSNQNFYTSITTPFLQNISPSFFLYNPRSGVKTIQGIAEPITNTYGVDQQGNSVSNDNPYGYKITWVNASGQAGQVIISY